MQVKTCTRCGETKPLDQFAPVRRSEPDKLQTWCRGCFSMANKRNYWKNPEPVRQRVIVTSGRRRAESRAKAVEYLLAHPCVDCGERDIVVLQFDHLRDKSFDLSLMIAWGASWARIEAEIAKCVVRCANCHHRMTAHRHRERAAAAGAPRASSRRRPVQLLLAASAVSRRCRVCREDRPLTDFPFRSIAKQTRHWICLTCQRNGTRAWYARTVGRDVRSMRCRGSASRSELVARVFNYLIDHACVDCGEVDPVVLDFDHLRDKVDDVSSLVALRRPWAEVLAEIEKCEVRCANCHARKTAREIASYKTKVV